MSASAAAMDLGNLRVKTRIVPNGVISYVCTPLSEPRPQERQVNSLRKLLVESGIGRFRNVRKVMKPFRNLFVLLKIRFQPGTSREEAQNRMLMALSTSTDSGPAHERMASRGDDGTRRADASKPPYRNRRYYIAKNRRR